MQIYNLTSKRKLNNLRREDHNFIICAPNEILDLKDKYHLDDESIFQCIDGVDKVSFLSSEYHSFISVVNFRYENREITTTELNIFIGESFLILVVPETLIDLNQKIDEFLNSKKNLNLNLMYHHIIGLVLESVNDGLNHLEDDIKNLESEMINQHLNRTQFLAINKFKEITYKAIKHVREFSYISDQLITNEHQFLHKEYAKYFLNMKTRIDKAYELSQHLGKLSDNLLNIYDSRMTAKTNEIVTRLTIVTIFFGPMTIITGIYGMNFKVMPEINFKYGYPLAIFMMFFISGIIYFILKKRKIV